MDCCGRVFSGERRGDGFSFGGHSTTSRGDDSNLGDLYLGVKDR